MKSSVSRPALALGGVAALATLSLASPAIAADQGNSKPDGGRHLGQAKQTKHADNATAPAAPSGHGHRTVKAHPSHPSKPAKQPPGQAHAHPAHAQPAGAAAQPASNGSPQPGPKPAHGSAASGDPSGNNGTVKIDRLGDVDRIPNNVPHPGCTFQVEWYGFDGGADVVSTVSFTMQAPTRDASLSVDGPLTVPVGGDAASGAGTASGLDAVQAYTLSFTGTPAKQGYHVRLTVATPRSRGNDTKTKVFWVEPCTGTAAPAAPTAVPTPQSAAAPSAGSAGSTPVAGGAPGATGTGLSQEASSSFFAASADEAADVSADEAGQQTSGSSGSSVSSGSAVPLAVDAGQHGSALSRWSRSPLGLALVLSGLTLAGAGAVLRLRRRA